MDINIPNLMSTEQGAVFPYVLIIMTILSSYLLTLYEYEQYQLDQSLMLEEQEIIQNLIQISIYDFKLKQQELEISSNKKMIHFDYETGQISIEYQLIEEGIIQLNLSVITKASHTERPFLFTTNINV